MGRSILASIASVAGAFALVAAMLLSGGLATAQDGTPPPEFTEDDVPRPAHIHSGTCEELGDVVYPLGDLTGVTIQGSPVASPIVENPESPDIVQGEVVIESITEVETTFDELFGAEHAINVHDSAENIGLYIACGNIEGEPEDGRLEIDIHPLNNSGFEGIAVLEETEEGVITVTVTLRDVSDVEATPAL
ncbi:MAG TPA: hypothetical protein VGR22_03590 [Thermomicrobiales bacterium]|nr:hypothetical protein [Thermomicrobiales bacterium]